MKRRTQQTFYCFSPPIMLATFFIELFLAAYLLLRYKATSTVKLAIMLLVLLAIFQLAEYGICETWFLSQTTWAKIGFVAITFLPPIGLHLVHKIANQNSRYLVLTAYLFGLVWSLFFLFGPLLEGAVCTGNYIIFNIPEPFEGMYYLYYNITLAVSIVLAHVYANKTTREQIKRALRILIVGYLAFIIPSIIFHSFDSYTGVDSPLPSIMCGFAVLLALLLSFGSIPHVATRRKD